MKRKVFLLVPLFISILLISTLSFAAEVMNDIKDSMRNNRKCCW